MYYIKIESFDAGSKRAALIAVQRFIKMLRDFMLDIVGVV